MEIVSSKAKQFGKVIVEKKDEFEELHVTYTEKADEMLFKLNVEVTLTDFGGESEEQMLDEDAEIDDVEIDDLDMDVDENAWVDEMDMEDN